MAGPDPSDTWEVSDSWFESDGSQSAAVCTWDPRSEPLNEAAASMAIRLSVCISTGEGLFTIRAVVFTLFILLFQVVTQEALGRKEEYRNGGLGGMYF
ncbi:hypothetical protein NDU88_001440 [Pleurodeles waltl]|uniref:Uncharacterized protein n=1 Tax=Pleurodeles waltl TaxID=8319 RepID=A0AAV7W124_PLEWA|nr:hypothetical protein NDU88_001440 [Pleurodeles waltl]